MQSRYALRFENGERQGETIPITGSGATVGRKPGNSVQILDASVSGRHAEFLVEDGGVLLRDLGSTNGTRVGNERISERRVAHGDEILLGNVKLLLIDSTLDAPASSDLPAVASAGAVRARGYEQDDEVKSVSAERIQRAGQRSIVGAMVLVLALGAGAAGWWWFRGKSSAGPAAQVRAVEPVAGNLLASGYSFEGEGAGWETDSASPVSFSVDRASRRSGDGGLGAITAGQDWALARSAAVRVGTTRGLSAKGWLRAEGQVEARFGLELVATSGASATTIAWAAPANASGEFEAVEISTAVPGSYDSVRVVVLARSKGPDGGSVDLDDVALVPAGDAPAPEAIEQFELFRVGSDALSLFKIDRTLASDIHVRRGEPASLERAALSASKRENGFAASLGTGPGRTLSFRVDETLVSGGFASTGEQGLKSHSGEFTREKVTSLICGKGKDLVRIAFAAPCEVRGAPEGGGLRIDVPLAEAVNEATLQIVFLAEREEAHALARVAREQEKLGQLGPALASWTRIRDEFPFESSLFDEAETARSRIAEQGQTASRDLRREIERARFFRLVDLYRRCLAEAGRIAERFAGSEVERDVRGLAATVEDDLAQLEVDLQKAERARLEAIARSLDEDESPKLAARVREYLAQRFRPAGVGTSEVR